MIPGIGMSVSKLNTQKLTPMWIALDFNGYNYMYYSYDATTWVRTTIAWAGKSVANNGKMWVMGCGYGRMQYSANGINWTTTDTGGLFTNCNAVAWNGTMWVGGCTGTNSFISSTDGINWTARGTSALTTGCNGVAWNGSLWVAVGTGTYKIASSTDAVTWTGRDTSVFTSGNGVAWNGSIWVAAGNGTTNTLASSTDGVTWTGRGTTILSAGYGICVGGTNTFYVVGNGPYYQIAASSSGTSWSGMAYQLNPFVAGGEGKRMAFNGTDYGAVGGFTNKFFVKSTNGSTFTNTIQIRTYINENWGDISSYPAPKLYPAIL